MTRSSPHSPPHARRRLGIERRELVTLAVVALAAAGLWTFLRLALYVNAGEVDELDHRLLLLLRSSSDPADPLGPHWFEELVRDFTALGGMGILALLAAASAGYLVLAGKRRTALTIVLAVVGGVLISTLLKGAFDRARPDLVPHGMRVTTQSFPSGHSMLSAVTYLTLAAVLARVQPSWILKSFVLGLGVLLSLLVGCSRVYLGVHWPSDVLAGWSAGIVWAAGVWWVTERLQQEGAIEPEPPAPAA